MPEYRRMFQPGGSFFLTLVTYRRETILGSASAVALLRSAVAEVRARRPFEVLGAVVLPDHVHFVWALPPGDTDYPIRVAATKAIFSRKHARSAESEGGVSASRLRRRERTVWQRRYWEHTIRDERDLQAHMDYIHYNPVKHGYASCPHAWRWSSFHRWVKEGRYPDDWACCCRGTVEPPSFREIGGSVGE